MFRDVRSSNVSARSRGLAHWFGLRKYFSQGAQLNEQAERLDVDQIELSRERFVLRSFRLAGLFSLFTFFVMLLAFATVPSARSELLRSAPVVAVIAALGLVPKISYRLRIWFVLSCYFAFILYESTNSGLEGGILLHHFLFVLCFAILIGWRYGVLVWLLSVMTVVVTGTLTVSGWLSPASIRYPISDELTMFHVGWLTINYALVSGAALLVVAKVLRDIESLWHTQQASLIQINQKSDALTKALARQSDLTTALEGALQKEQALNDALGDTLRKEQRLHELKTGMLQTISHEFRTPLTVLKMSSGIIEQFGADRDAAWTAQRLKQIDLAVDELSVLFDEVVLANEQLFQEADVGAISVHQLEQALKRAAAEIGERADQPVEFTFDATSAEMLHQSLPVLLQVWTQLLDNAVKFTLNDTSVVATGHYDGETLHCQVIDQGIGIPEADLPYVFDSLFRAGNVGTVAGLGIGLYNARQATQLLKGTLTVTSSAETSGTIASLRIPNQTLA